MKIPQLRVSHQCLQVDVEASLVIIRVNAVYISIPIQVPTSHLYRAPPTYPRPCCALLFTAATPIPLAFDSAPPRIIPQTAMWIDTSRRMKG